jgi:osmoprotectant transport system permease protein
MHGPRDPIDHRAGRPDPEPTERHINFFEYLTDPFTRDALLEQAIAHIQISIIPIVISTLIGIPLGVMAQRSRVARPVILNTASTFLTIPSLALFGLLVGVVGIGNPPVIVALTLYALLPIIRNTLSGLQSVDPAIVESARGMGMGGFQRLWKIELPIAWPVIIAGVRVATQLTVGIAAIAVLIGGSGLGEEIYNNGIRRIGSPGVFNNILGGTLAIVVIAYVFDGILLLVERLTTSKGIQ